MVSSWCWSMCFQFCCLVDCTWFHWCLECYRYDPQVFKKHPLWLSNQILSCCQDKMAMKCFHTGCNTATRHWQQVPGQKQFYFAHIQPSTMFSDIQIPNIKVADKQIRNHVFWWKTCLLGGNPPLHPTPNTQAPRKSNKKLYDFSPGVKTHFIPPKHPKNTKENIQNIQKHHPNPPAPSDWEALSERSSAAFPARAARAFRARGLALGGVAVCGWFFFLRKTPGGFKRFLLKVVI